MRRDQDIVNPRVASRSFILVPAAVGDHPYWCARILGIFDLQVLPSPHHSTPVRLNFLWIRWLGEDPDQLGNFETAAHSRVGYVRFGSGSDVF